jgi:hypothetical protein
LTTPSMVRANRPGMPRLMGIEVLLTPCYDVY